MALGYPHPRFLEAELLSTDIVEWRAYSELEEFGSIREDVRAGTIASLLYNSNRPQTEKAKFWYDFFPNVLAPIGKLLRIVRPTKTDLVKQAQGAIDLMKQFNRDKFGK